jgi:signal peptide peptidase SppA
MVALSINSPGGSPAQSNLITERIRQLAEEKNMPVVAFTEDVAASGGYFLACAADRVYADPFSVIGSVGVVSASFGLEEFIARHGITRRVQTCGKYKVTGDPFAEESDEDKAYKQALLDVIHREFIKVVKQRRGAQLLAAAGSDLPDGVPAPSNTLPLRKTGKKEGSWQSEPQKLVRRDPKAKDITGLSAEDRAAIAGLDNSKFPDDVFEARVWVGEEAAKLGLVDGIGQAHTVVPELVGEPVHFVPMGPEDGFFGRFAGGSMESAIAGAIRAEVADTSMWGRYGVTQ